MSLLNLNEKSVLVTGAGGFIGSHVTESLLKEGAMVRAFLRYTSNGTLGNLKYLQHPLGNLEIIFGDLKNPGAVMNAMRDVDIVFNLASLVSIPYSYVNPREYFDNNIYFILNILEAAKSLETSCILHISTSEVYGTAETIPINESHPLKGQSPYSASKIGADKIAESYYRSFDSPVVIVRPFNTYGPRQSVRAVIPTIITQALNGEAIFLGDVRPTRDFTYVEDTVQGILAAAKAGPEVFGEVINIGTGNEITIQDISKKILELTQSDAKIVFDAMKVRPPKSEVQRLCADITKAKKLLNWNCQFSLEDGLYRTIEWFKTHRIDDMIPKSYV